MKKAIFIFSLLMLAGFSVWAQEPGTPRSDARQNAQRVRIHEGRADGDLTKRETSLLNKEQRHIRRSEHRAKTDGNVTVAERRKLDRKQDRANRHIHRAKTMEQSNLINKERHRSVPFFIRYLTMLAPGLQLNLRSLQLLCLTE